MTDVMGRDEKGNDAVNDKRLLEETYYLLARDLPKYARYCLRISNKGGQEIPFLFNKAQKYLHDRIEKQKKSF
jgi:hypothetical protein